MQIKIGTLSNTGEITNNKFDDPIEAQLFLAITLDAAIEAIDLNQRENIKIAIEIN